jgi:SAM-dependent methyltransferase
MAISRAGEFTAVSAGMTKLMSRLLVYAASLSNRVCLWMPYQPLPEAGIRVDRASTERTLDRWARIEPTLPPEPVSVLDIGCNVGFFSVRMAQRGCFVTGLDKTLYATLLHHIKTSLGLHNLATAGMLLTPGNIHTLPRYDCTFLLSVFHHWCVAHGSDTALSMLATAYERTNRVMYFETGQPDTTGEKYRSRLPQMTPTPLAWMERYFKERGAAEVRNLGYFRGRHLVAVFK